MLQCKPDPKHVDTASGFWLSLQDYDTEEAVRELGNELAKIHRFEPLAA